MFGNGFNQNVVATLDNRYQTVILWLASNGLNQNIVATLDNRYPTVILWLASPTLVFG